DLLIGRALDLTGTPGNRALDVLSGNGLRPRLFNCDAQTRVHARVAPAHLCRNDDLAAQLRKDPTADGILLSFTDADVLPFGMACHGVYFGTDKPCSVRRRGTPPLLSWPLSKQFGRKAATALIGRAF